VLVIRDGVRVSSFEGCPGVEKVLAVMKMGGGVAFSEMIVVCAWEGKFGHLGQGNSGVLS